MRIASMRFHWVVPERATAAKVYTPESPAGRKQLWAYTRFDAAARACLLSLTAEVRGPRGVLHRGAGHDRRRAEPRTCRKYFPDVPIRGDFSGNRSFFDFVQGRAHARLDARGETPPKGGGAA